MISNELWFYIALTWAAIIFAGIVFVIIEDRKHKKK